MTALPKDRRGDTPETDVIYFPYGLTLLDYFAARAPIDIPDWFKHREPEYTVPPRPNYMALATKEHQDIALDWQRDPCFDLPEELAWFGEMMKTYRNAIAERDELNRVARFFQWRWYYANAMIAEREHK
jgi:hypothetical protein